MLDSALLPSPNPAQTPSHWPDVSRVVGVKNSAGSVFVLGESVKMFSLWEQSDAHVCIYFIFQHTHGTGHYFCPRNIHVYLNCTEACIHITSGSINRDAGSSHYKKMGIRYDDGDRKECCPYRDVSRSPLTIFLPEMLPAWHLHGRAAVAQADSG